MKIENTIGKYIYYIDRNGAWRISKAMLISGNTISVQDAVGGRERLHPTTSKIFGVVTKSKNRILEYEQIEYIKIHTKGKKINKKLIKKELQAIRIKPLRTKRPRAGRPRRK